MELIEPLRELFKDEVRRLGVELGLPKEMVYRHPFPGPGLGVRILGEVKKEYTDLLRLADNIFIEELRKHELYDKISQALVVFLPVRSVGIMGDNRKYDYVVCLRAVVTVDFMTAHWAELPYDFLGHVSSRIMNETAKLFSLRQIETISVHDFHPCCNEVINKLLLVIVLSIHFCIGAQDGVRT